LSFFNVARSAGPALAGFLIALCGTAGSYTAQAIFYLLATIWTIQLRSGQQPARTLSWRAYDPLAGIRPRHPQSRSHGTGMLLSATGIGALCSSILLASFGDRWPRINLMLGGVTLYGIIIVGFAASPWFELSLALMGIVGIVHVTSHALGQTVIQTYSPADSGSNHGYLSHDPYGVVGGRNTYRGIIHVRGSAVGSGLDEHCRCSCHGWHLLGYAARTAHPLAQYRLLFDHRVGEGSIG
jgi:MFS family permease